MADSAVRGRGVNVSVFGWGEATDAGLVASPAIGSDAQAFVAALAKCLRSAFGGRRGTRTPDIFLVREAL